MHLSTSQIGQETLQPLTEVHLLVEDTIHPQAPHTPVWLDVKTGLLKRAQPDDSMQSHHFLTAYLPITSPESVKGNLQITFSECPTCLRNLKRYKLSTLETKGEGAFANLVKTQVIQQPPQKAANLDSPNEGRKSLLFSDGRQKAARLALFIPREVELDSFRQAITLAAQRLTRLGKEVRPTRELYMAFYIPFYWAQFSVQICC